ncbi:acyltransferase [Alcanivorax sp. S6407]|uniref:acyltransferase family protein n=1 Tax=Alcanivorax sp. S6407 TaxID=2926424 RepID=UPI001FF31A33|nr:acyltransferase family protein [Alcanivorax sp. S6407]MCK0152847.1 acyltransferase [Alcanivorax sp. S6407]
MPELKYRADIDGLRALAVLPVMIFHAGADWLPGGFVGVDIFFVISGYLISKIIINEVDRGGFSFSRFYERRIRRIVPALLVVLFVTVILFQAISLPDQAVNTSKSAIAALLSVSNFYFWGQSGYFSPTAEFMPLLHTWSLGVEEQFYLFFPVFLILVKRVNISLPAILSIGLILAFGLGVWLSLNKPSVAYYLLPARGWELAIGAVLATGSVPRVQKGVLKELLPALGVLLICLSFFYIDSGMVFPGWVALLPCLGAALVIHGDGTSLVASRLLSSRFMVFVGLLSYSLYLWHWPILTALRVVTASVHLELELAVLGLLLSFLIGWASWRYVESPFRRKDGGKMKSRVKGLLIVSAGLVSISFVSIFYQGFPERLNDSARKALAAAEDVDPFRAKCSGLKKVGECRFGDPDLPVTYAVIGDSHAAAIRPAIEASGLMDGRAGTLFWSGGCPLLDGARRFDGHRSDECAEFKDKVWDTLEREKSIDTVFLGGRWPALLTGTLPESGGSNQVYLQDDYSVSISDDENFKVFARSLKRTLERLSHNRIDVVIIGSVPEPGFHVPHVSALARYLGLDYPGGIYRDEVSQRAGMADRFISGLLPSSVSFISVWQGFCDDVICDIEREGVPIYYDDDHLSNSAAVKVVAPLIKENRISFNTN